MQHTNDSANTRAHTTATPTKAGNHTALKIHPAYQALYGQEPESEAEIISLFRQLSKAEQSLMIRTVRAVTDRNTEALEALKADSSPESARAIDSLIADIQGVKP